MQNPVKSNLEGQGSCIVDSYKCDKCKAVPHGGTHIEAGDKLAVLCNEDLVMSVQYELEEKCKTLFQGKINKE